MPRNYDKNADPTEHLILAVGQHGWCTSNWRPLYYLLWKTNGSLAQPKLLLDHEQIAFLAAPIDASLQQNDLLMEYSVGSRDGGITRREVRHYVFQDGIPGRVDPIVLSPRDFVDAWRQYPWEQSSQWTEPPARRDLQKWHQEAGKEYGEYDYPTTAQRSRIAGK